LVLGKNDAPVTVPLYPLPERSGSGLPIPGSHHKLGLRTGLRYIEVLASFTETAAFQFIPLPKYELAGKPFAPTEPSIVIAGVSVAVMLVVSVPTDTPSI